MAERSEPSEWRRGAKARHDRCEREDLVMFVNACFAATGQNEYYTDRYRQSVSIEFLHQYVLINYRLLYARALATGINHFNQAAIIVNLLDAGAPADLKQRVEEGQLIAAALWRLPANRVFSLFTELRRRGINNRRTRAVIKTYLRRRNEAPFDAVKYRKKYRAAVAHAHVSVGPEFTKFLFDNTWRSAFETELFEAYRQAGYTQQALYDLPFTVAESFAQKHNVPRDVFFRKIQPKMTSAEKLRYQNSVKATAGGNIEFDLARAPLTRLAIYVLSLPLAERRTRAIELHSALQTAANRSLRRSPLQLGRVVAVLDCSRSMWGTRDKRRRPLAVALAASYLLRAASSDYTAIWTPPRSCAQFEFLVEPNGQTAIAEPVIDALEQGPDLVLIVSDGYENDPPGAVADVARVYLSRLADRATADLIHANPVFDSDHFSPRSFGDSIGTVGLRDAEDLPTMLGFAKFAVGSETLSELHTYLKYRVDMLLEAEARTRKAEAS